MTAILGLFIDGESRVGGGRRTMSVLNPADDEVVADLTLADARDLDDALSASAGAFAEWRDSTPLERSALLRTVAGLIRRDREALARILTEDQGKVLAESFAEIAVTAESFEWAAEECKRTYGRVIPSRDRNLRLFVEYEPIGPVAAFSPWNFPAFNPGRKMCTAVAAGCSIIVKPSEETPRCSLEIARLFAEAGAPRGLVNVVFGNPPEVARHLIKSPIVRKVAFTGSVLVGKSLTALAAEGLKPVTMELGGHAPVLVFDDVDVEAVAKEAAAARYRNAGQVCISPSRFFVQRSAHGRFVDAFSRAAADIVVGDGRDGRTTMGPLASARRVSAMENLVADAVSRGARIAFGGQRTGNTGHYFAPTVLTDVPREARVLQEEIFGPIAPIVSFDDEAEAVGRANELPLGLASFVFTENGRRAQRLASRIEAGAVAVNSTTVALPEIPFGGVKESGLGRESGEEGILEHMIKKTITMRAR
ncbi:NAD-dependent succinate-semialdehyde dehydrogenase [Mesorhizobium sp. AD1-1]|uniref:NAD-dependent succinate-semialdehyde dehydrogenase n=1 Tax=Mesorhizobium sp. AD1-1 TaxID=2876621 RepID=UPI001CCC947E|nr:NAD-dependent succinate-semialdehyde dehydrogenase [Mesorhizobium sp. AD1-1]MBZ9719206.1 NAD-dependent succinate-semialdehyde dehydrogenase [Mesorhizobium sp. AD1-1]